MGFHRELCRRYYALPRFVAHSRDAAQAENVLRHFTEYAHPNLPDKRRNGLTKDVPVQDNPLPDTVSHAERIPQELVEEMRTTAARHFVLVSQGIEDGATHVRMEQNRDAVGVTYPLFGRVRFAR